MCGIFGFVSCKGERPDLTRLRRLALFTQTRGEHAFGLAWLDEDGAIQTFKQPGAAREHLAELDRCRDAVMVIGHCRYATHGSPLDNRNNHPHAAGGGQVVHNGVVTNHAQLARQHNLRPASQCDSEVLGLLMARGRGSVTQRAAWAARQSRGDMAMLGLWRNPARLLVARRGRPLHFGQAREGFYFASLADGLPQPVCSVLDGSARVVVYQRRRLRLESAVVRIEETACGSGHLNHPNTLEIMDL